MELAIHCRQDIGSLSCWDGRELSRLVRGRSGVQIVHTAKPTIAYNRATRFPEQHALVLSKINELNPAFESGVWPVELLSPTPRLLPRAAAPTPSREA